MFYTAGGISVGGTSVNNQLASIGVVTSTFYSSGNGVILGPVTASNSVTSSVVGLSLPGFSVGDYCAATSNATATNAFSSGVLKKYSRT